MRWFWIDRFTKFVSGESAEAVKSISLSEEVVDEYSPCRTFLPASVIIEGIAQTGGLLLGQMSDFNDRIVLAKVTKSEFLFEAEPGTKLTIDLDKTSLSLPIVGGEAAWKDALRDDSKADKR